MAMLLLWQAVSLVILIYTLGSTGIAPSNWFEVQGSCYKIINKTRTWNAAKSACESLGSELAVVNSQAENQAITARLTQRAWIGMHRDPKDKNRWLWVDGSRPSYTNWDKGQPQATEQAVVVYKSGLWHDYPSDSRAIPSFVCETTGCVGCNETLHADQGGFHSPNYPNKYPDGEYCSWRIMVNPSQQVYLNFSSFNLQADNNTDAVYVYDGNNDTGEVLGVFYGGHPPPKEGIYSSSNSLLVIFKSDYNDSYSGFDAFYHALECSASFLNVYIRSEGCDDPGRTSVGCGRSYIIVNGKDRSLHLRGHNVVLVDAITGAVLESKGFETFRYTTAGGRLSNYLNAINGNKIVLVATQDDTSRYSSQAFGALRRLGATDPILSNYRGSYAFVGSAQSNKPYWIRQVQNPRYKGPSEITLRIPLQNRQSPPLGMESGVISDAQISASSHWDNNHAARQARLHFKQQGSTRGGWSARTNDVNQWLQVDIGGYTTVTRVATQGRNVVRWSSVKQWVTKFKLQYSVDGMIFQFYKEPVNNSAKVFTGNQDKDTVVYNKLSPPIKARYIRLRPVAWHSHISMRMELYGCQGCMSPLGMESGVIPDSQITASSQKAGQSPARARLNNWGWTADANDIKQWLQVNLGSYFRVTRVATQGVSYGSSRYRGTRTIGPLFPRPWGTRYRSAGSWVTSYRLQYSDKGIIFHFYQEPSDTSAKVFSGNQDHSSIVSNQLSRPITARYIRILPVQWYNDISMRLEIYGCSGCMAPLGMESKLISDDKISASSQLGSNYSAVQARLHFKADGSQAGGWSALSNDPNQWLQVDLGSTTRVSRVATQGRNGYDEWVTKYMLQYSDDGVTFEFYTNVTDTSPKVFEGNQDSDTVVYNKLQQPMITRYIRVVPTSWNNRISMRMELFGCPDCISPVGLESGSISDSQISASSQQDDNHSPQRARLNTKISGVKQGGWAPLKSDLTQWLQVNLGRFIRVTRVATQGRNGYEQWVTQYSLQYRKDRVSFEFYKETHESSAKVFDGNDDSDTTVYNIVNPPFTARVIRIVPLEWHKYISMRLEIFGCTACIAPLGMENRAIPDAQITASTQWDDNHAPARARLNTKLTGVKRGGWSARKCDLDQWLQVDIGGYTTVTRVATQGRNGHDQWVTKFRLQYSDDGVHFHFYQEPGDSSAKVFDGNQDSDTIVFNTLTQPITARYIRVRPVAWRVCISMRLELYGCPGCAAPLGLEDGAITDAQITASSQKDGHHSAVQARLNYKGDGIRAGGWSAVRNDPNQWIQVDLRSYTRVTRVATQGRNGYDEWVTKYRLQYSDDDERAFQFYKQQGVSVAKVFSGNVDSDTIVHNKLSPPIIARYIRIRPVEWNNGISIRMEIYGCPACIAPLGMESEAISDAQISASSQMDDNHAANQARLNPAISGNKREGWSALTNDLDQWLQVDLGSYTRVSRVATQGRNGYEQWVTKYRLQYGDDGVTFNLYTEAANDSAKVFDGNQDSDSVVYNILIPPITARYIRLLPVEWNNRISLRMEIYGCPGCITTLGMENGLISDTQISASSQLDNTHSAEQGRLHSKADGRKWGSWSALRNDLRQWFQVDLRSFTRVTGVATQGRNGYDQWVTKYNLLYSDEGDGFHFYEGPGNNAAKVFIGNQDTDTVAYNTLSPPITARYIRLKPVEWFGHISMRMEIYGCPGCIAPLGMAFGAISDDQISCSSQQDNNHTASQARLHFKGDGIKAGGWSAIRNDPNQWLEVDFGSYTRVSRVATQGSYAHDQWVTRYKVQYSNDGMTFQVYRKTGDTSTKVFGGNQDRNSVVYNVLSPPITTRFIRLTPVEWHNHISMRIEIYGCPGCEAPLGMDSGAIADAQITASSQWDANHAAIQARLHFKGVVSKAGSWSSRTNDVNQWIQVDIGGYTTVTRVATQGRNGHDQWVTQYRLQYSDDGVTFHFYKEPRSRSPKDFLANRDRDTIVYNKISPPITAQYIRLRPVGWHRHISMRMEIYGCPACIAPLGMENGLISDSQISASSQLDNTHSSRQARLHIKADGIEGGGWSALTNDLNQWLEVDLGSYTTVTRIATQGRNGYEQWVTKYRIQYSYVGITFKFYKKAENSSAKVFEGNEDSDTVVFNKLTQPITARYIRVLPIEWHKHISMRMEIYGCPGCIEPLGMESGAIIDSQISASSVLDSTTTPGQARLHVKADESKAGGWSALKDDLNQWLEVDLGSYTKVTRLATQGRNGYDEWVTKYRLEYSDDGVNFQTYREPGGSLAKVFDGNQNSDTVAYSVLSLPITARFVRLVPVAWHNRIALRIEIYGCPGCTSALGMESKEITDAQITSSSQMDDTHGASESRLNFKADGLERGGWSALINDYNQWIQVNLGAYKRVTRVASQGRNGKEQWVSRYRLQYSDDGETFLFYKETTTSSPKVFDGNHDSDTIVYSILSPPITARYIRVRPVEWHNHISMRIELYGCFAPDAAPTSPLPEMTTTTFNSTESVTTVEIRAEANRGAQEAGKGINIAAVVVPVLLCILLAVLLLVGFLFWKRRRSENEQNIKPVLYSRATNELPTATDDDDRDVLLCQDS